MYHILSRLHVVTHVLALCRRAMSSVCSWLIPSVFDWYFVPNTVYALSLQFTSYLQKLTVGWRILSFGMRLPCLVIRRLSWTRISYEKKRKSTRDPVRCLFLFPVLSLYRSGLYFFFTADPEFRLCFGVQFPSIFPKFYYTPVLCDEASVVVLLRYSSKTSLLVSKRLWKCILVP